MVRARRRQPAAIWVDVKGVQRSAGACRRVLGYSHVMGASVNEGVAIMLPPCETQASLSTSIPELQQIYDRARCSAAMQHCDGTVEDGCVMLRSWFARSLTYPGKCGMRLPLFTSTRESSFKTSSCGLFRRMDRPRTFPPTGHGTASCRLTLNFA